MAGGCPHDQCTGVCLMVAFIGSQGTVGLTLNVGPANQISDVANEVFGNVQVTRWTLHGKRKMANVTPKAQNYSAWVPGAVLWWIDVEGLLDTQFQAQWFNKALAKLRLFYVTGDSEVEATRGYFTNYRYQVQVDGVVKWKARFQPTTEYTVV